MNIEASETAALDFADKDSVANWAQSAVAALTERGMIAGVGDNQFAPAADITRGSVMKMLNSMVSNYVVDNAQEITGDVKGVVIIAAASDVVIKDAKLAENLIIAPKGAEAAVTLAGTTVAKNVYVNGGSAKLTVDQNAAAGAVVMSAPKATAAVAGKVATLGTTEAASNATLTVAKGATVTAVALAGADGKLDVAGTVGEVQVSATAPNANIVAQSGAKIDKVESSGSKLAVSGSGTVGNIAVLAGEGAKIAKETKVDKLENKSDTPVMKGDTTVKPGESTGGSTGGGGGGGGGNTPSATTYSINVTATGGTVTSDSKLTGYTAAELGDAGIDIVLKVTANPGHVLTAFTVGGDDKKSDVADGSITVCLTKAASIPVVATFMQPVSNFALHVVETEADFNTYVPAAYRNEAGQDFEASQPTLPWAVLTYDVNIAGDLAVSYTKGGADGTFTKGVGTIGNEEKTDTFTPSVGTGKYTMYEVKADLGISEPLSGTYVFSVLSGDQTVTASDLFKKTDEDVSEHTVTWSIDGATTTTTVLDGEQIVPPAPPVKTGYTFVEWCTGSSEGSAYTFTQPVTDDLALFAKFEKAEYTITYNLDDGTNASGNPATYAVDTETITLADATRAGYTFGGWYKDSGFSNKVTSIAKGSTGNITLFAKWTKSDLIQAVSNDFTTSEKGEDPYALFQFNYNRLVAGAKIKLEVSVDDTVVHRYTYDTDSVNASAYVQWSLRDMQVSGDANSATGSAGEAIERANKTILPVGTVFTYTITATLGNNVDTITGAAKTVTAEHAKQVWYNEAGTGFAVTTEQDIHDALRVFQTVQVDSAAVTLTKNLTIPAGKTLTIPAGKTLTINKNIDLTIKGTVVNNGTITNQGDIWADYGSTLLMGNVQVVGGSAPLFTLVDGTTIHINSDGEYDVRQTDVLVDTDGECEKVVTLNGTVILATTEMLKIRNGVDLQIGAEGSIVLAPGAMVMLRAHSKLLGTDGVEILNSAYDNTYTIGSNLSVVSNAPEGEWKLVCLGTETTVNASTAAPTVPAAN